jgi:hypothetical protein
MFRSLETVKQRIVDLDANVETVMLVRRTAENRISGYRILCEEKRLLRRTLTNIFVESSTIYPICICFVPLFFKKHFPRIDRFVDFLDRSEF